MEAARRIYLSRLIEKIEKNKDFAERLGTKNQSELKKQKEEKEMRA